jgi:hypothetical protein
MGFQSPSPANNLRNLCWTAKSSGQCHQFVEDVLQSLKPTLTIPGCTEFVLPALQVQTVRFADFRYFATSLRDAFFSWILHHD